MPKYSHRVIGYNVLTAKGGIAKSFGIGPDASDLLKGQLHDEAKKWLKDHLMMYGELELVEIAVVSTRKYKPRPIQLAENVHPMSQHLAHRASIDELHVPPMPKASRALL